MAIFRLACGFKRRTDASDRRGGSAWPIPHADAEDRAALADLARRATKAAGAELTAIEDEINRIVYRLFKLEPDEIALIEGATVATKPSLDSKAALFSRVLPELAAAAPYFALAAVKRRLSELRIEVADGSLLHYLSDAVAKGLVHDAGKGWYSGLEQPLALDGKPLAHLLRLVQKEFPLLEFCCWSTHQINPFTHHILAKHTIFLYVEVDAITPVTEFLRAEKWDVLPNPNRKDVQRLHRPGDRSVIVRPAISRQPKAVDHLAPPEKALVDLQVEAEVAMIMDNDEALGVLRNAASSGLINIADLISYASRRRVDIARESESSSPHLPVLWS